METKQRASYFEVYLRALGLSYTTTGKTLLEFYLAIYGFLVILLEGYQLKEQVTHVFHSRPEQRLLLLVSKILIIGYRVIHIVIVVEMLLQRQKQRKIHKLLQDIDDDLQLQLYQQPKKVSLTLPVLYIGLECFWNAAAFFVVCLYSDLMSFSAFLLLLFTIQALRARYLQYALIVAQIDGKLQLLENSIVVNLIETHEQLNIERARLPRKSSGEEEVREEQDLNAYKNKAISLWAAQCNANNAQCHPEPEVAIEGDVEHKHEDDNYLSVAIKPHLVQRIFTMQCIYGKIMSIIRNMTDLFGISIVLMNFLCVCDFTEACYAFTLPLDQADMDFLLMLRGIFMIIPTILEIVLLCWICENCSKRGSRISLLLSRVPATRMDLKCNSYILDDFTLQIMKNPIEFSAGRFHQLNLKTLAVMFLFIVQFLVILLQFVDLTREDSG